MIWDGKYKKQQQDPTQDQRPTSLPAKKNYKHTNNNNYNHYYMLRTIHTTRPVIGEQVDQGCYTLPRVRFEPTALRLSGKNLTSAPMHA